jgi:predicted transcriptional regulator
MQHRGQLLKKILRDSGKTIKGLAAYLHVSARTVSNYYDYADLSWNVMEKAGKFLGHDFTEEIPYPGMMMVKEKEAQYNSMTEKLKECENERNELYKKYINKLEEFNTYMKMNPARI